MNSASKVGEIFKKAGDAYNELGDMIVLLHPSAQELNNILDQQQKQVLKRDLIS